MEVSGLLLTNQIHRQWTALHLVKQFMLIDRILQVKNYTKMSVTVNDLINAPYQIDAAYLKNALPLNCKFVILASL